jgi:hypothetical protein
MAIDCDLIVKVDEGQILFTPPGLNEWAEVLKMDGKSVEEQATLLVEKVVAVENLTYKDGRPVTLEDVKSCKFPVSFMFLLKSKWINAVIASAKGEAEGKNE